MLGLLLFAGAFLGSQTAITSARQTVGVWAANRDLPQNARLGPGDLTTTEVRLPRDVLAGYAAASASLDGAVLTRPVRAGELIPTAWLSPEGAAVGGRSMTIPIAPEHAVGGDLRPGDRVDILATFDGGNPGARTAMLVREVEILDVVTSEGAVLGGRSLIGVTVSVSAEEAARLAFAINNGQLDVVRVDGASVDEVPPTIRGGDFP